MLVNSVGKSLTSSCGFQNMTVPKNGNTCDCLEILKTAVSFGRRKDIFRGNANCGDAFLPLACFLGGSSVEWLKMVVLFFQKMRQPVTNETTIPAVTFD